MALPVLGILYILLRLARQVAAGLWQRTRGKALQRATAMVAVAAVLAGLAWAWWPGADTYRPVQPYERGTLADVTTAAFPAAATGRMAEGQSGRTVALWPEGSRKPTRDDPQLSMVLVPRQSGTAGSTGSAGSAGSAGAAAPTAPSWVFPFDKPAAPEDDDNQSLAVNTTDGSVVYDVAFALVWADDGGAVDTRNEAYAFASCADCAAVAVGFQVVLIVGQTDVIVPENLSASANYNCVRCLTYALASQLVLTLDGPLSSDGTARLDALWQEIAAYGKDLRNRPLSEIQGRLSAFKDQIMAVIKADPNASPAGSPGTATTPATSGATPGATSDATSGASSSASPGAATGAAEAPSPRASGAAGTTGTTAPSGAAVPTAPASGTPSSVPGAGSAAAPGSGAGSSASAPAEQQPTAPAPASGTVSPAPASTAPPGP